MPPSPETPLAELVSRAGAGDRGAFETLDRVVGTRLQLYVQRIAATVVGGDCDVEDLMQLVLARVWRGLPSLDYRDAPRFYRWLTTVADRVVTDRARYLAALKRGTAGSLEAGADEFVLDPADPTTSVGTRLARREECQRVMAAVAALPEGQRVVLERHLIDGWSLAEIGESLDLSKNAVWERLHRGMSGLRAEMGSTQ